jgi:hypothetical protein
VGVGIVGRRVRVLLPFFVSRIQRRFDMVIRTDSKSVFVNVSARTLRLAPRGCPLPVGIVLGCLPKGDARQVRKALRKAGLVYMAGARRLG